MKETLPGDKNNSQTVNWIAFMLLAVYLLAHVNDIDMLITRTFERIGIIEGAVAPVATLYVNSSDGKVLYTTWIDIKSVLFPRTMSPSTKLYIKEVPKGFIGNFRKKQLTFKIRNGSSVEKILFVEVDSHKAIKGPSVVDYRSEPERIIYCSPKHDLFVILYSGSSALLRSYTELSWLHIMQDNPQVRYTYEAASLEGLITTQPSNHLLAWLNSSSITMVSIPDIKGEVTQNLAPSETIMAKGTFSINSGSPQAILFTSKSGNVFTFRKYCFNASNGLLLFQGHEGKTDGPLRGERLILVVHKVAASGIKDVAKGTINMSRPLMNQKRGLGVK